MTFDEAVARFSDAAVANGDRAGTVLHAVYCCGEALDVVCTESGHTDPAFMRDVSYMFGRHAFVAYARKKPISDVFDLFVGHARSGLRGWEIGGPI